MLVPAIAHYAIASAAHMAMRLRGGPDKILALVLPSPSKINSNLGSDVFGLKGPVLPAPSSGRSPARRMLPTTRLSGLFQRPALWNVGHLKTARNNLVQHARVLFCAGSFSFPSFGPRNKQRLLRKPRLNVNKIPFIFCPAGGDLVLFILY